MRYKEILKFWFGRVEETVIPSRNRARIWFGDSPEADQTIKHDFAADLRLLIDTQDISSWQETPHTELALIIMLDQFSRHVYDGTPGAFAQDAWALQVCHAGLQQHHDHHLSLIERVFYYYPLLHAEDKVAQEQSLIAFQGLAQMAIAETKVLYDSFLQFAMQHYDVIERFGRFPQRNQILGRESTPEELIYLKELSSEESKDGNT